MPHVLYQVYNHQGRGAYKHKRIYVYTPQTTVHVAHL